MGTAELVSTLDKGVQAGRIAPYVADFIVAYELKCTAEDVGYTEWGFNQLVADPPPATPPVSEADH